MEVCCEDVCVFVDRAVLNNCLAAFADGTHLVEPAVKKVDLQVKRPLGHVGVEVAEVRVLINRLKQRSPSIVLCELFGECTFSGADVAGDCYVFYFFQ